MNRRLLQGFLAGYLRAVILVIIMFIMKNKIMSIEKILFDMPGKITIKLEDGRIDFPIKVFS